MRVGVLALQGAFIEHIQMLHRLGVETREVRLPKELSGLDALIIPGGESTTIGKLAVMYQLMEPLKTFAQHHPVWGTCAGMIFLAKDIGKEDQPLLGVMNITVKRNAFGSQRESFVKGVIVPDLSDGKVKPYPGIFIRAPYIRTVGENVRVIGRVHDDIIVAARENNLLVTSFHPELTTDLRFHQYFIEMAKKEI